MKQLTIFVALLIFSTTVMAGGIYKKSAAVDFDTTYKKVYASLEESNFFIIEEINIGKSLSGFSKKWGEDYNRNKLDNIKVMIICNGWYANQVSNQDTDMLALCPMRVTLIQKDKTTSALFARPSTFAEGSKALPTLKKVEDIIIQAINKAFP